MRIYILSGILLMLIGWFGAKYYYEGSVTKTITKETDHTVTRTITIQLPDGTKRTETVVDQRETKKTSNSVKVGSSKKGLYVALLAKVNFSNNLQTPVYGVSVSKELLGPISVGVFGFTDKTVGLSVGISF